MTARTPVDERTSRKWRKLCLRYMARVEFKHGESPDVTCTDPFPGDWLALAVFRSKTEDMTSSRIVTRASAGSRRLALMMLSENLHCVVASRAFKAAVEGREKIREAEELEKFLREMRS